MSVRAEVAGLSQQWRSKGLIRDGALSREALHALEELLAEALVRSRQAGIGDALQMAELYAEHNKCPRCGDPLRRLATDLREMKRALDYEASL